MIAKMLLSIWPDTNVPTWLFDDGIILTCILPSMGYDRSQILHGLVINEPIPTYQNRNAAMSCIIYIYMSMIVRNAFEGRVTMEL
jgi:hypothetical protein